LLEDVLYSVQQLFFHLLGQQLLLKQTIITAISTFKGRFDRNSVSSNL
jgi:hypothetical protein